MLPRADQAAEAIIPCDELDHPTIDNVHYSMVLTSSWIVRTVQFHRYGNSKECKNTSNLVTLAYKCPRGIIILR
jgi:hypothetical protein